MAFTKVAIVSDVIVVGGGVMGLMISRLLLQAGVSVTLLEAGQCGQEASWAGGGIVSPMYPWRYSEPVTLLSQQAQSLFPDLNQQLLDETGIDPELTVTGMLMLDTLDAEQAFSWCREKNMQVERIAGLDKLRELEPKLGEFEFGVWMPHIANVRNPRLLRALKASVLRFDTFQLREFSPVVSIENNHVRLQSGEQISADKICVAAGSWTGQLLQTVGIELPIKPMKGEMILYKQPANWLRCMVMHDGRYAIPRRDGHIVVGSTLQDVGFDKQPNEAASLIQSAARLLPALAGIKPIRHWAGLRPGSPEGIPYMGQLPDRPDVYVCAGHFRNGLVLSPASAQFMAQILLGEPTSLDKTLYQVMR